MRLRGGGFSKLFSCSSSAPFEDQPRRPSAASSSSYTSSAFARSPGHVPAEWPQNYHRQHAAHSSHRPSVSHQGYQGQPGQQSQQLQQPIQLQSSPQQMSPQYPQHLEPARRQSSHGQLGVGPVEANPAYAVPMSGRMPVPGLAMQQVYIQPSATRRDDSPQRHGTQELVPPGADARTKKKEDEEAELAERMMDW